LSSVDFAPTIVGHPESPAVVAPCVGVSAAQSFTSRAIERASASSPIYAGGRHLRDGDGELVTVRPRQNRLGIPREDGKAASR
jgi:hypothetical protein